MEAWNKRNSSIIIKAGASLKPVASPSLLKKRYFTNRIIIKMYQYRASCNNKTKHLFVRGRKEQRQTEEEYSLILHECFFFVPHNRVISTH
jgi:hypothetical protein